MSVNTLYIKQNDLQPYYYVQILDVTDTAVAITGYTIYVTMKNIATDEIKIHRSSTGVHITDGANGKFEYRWQSGDTDTVGRYSIEFEIQAPSGKYTVPASKNAVINIGESLDKETINKTTSDAVAITQYIMVTIS